MFQMPEDLFEIVSVLREMGLLHDDHQFAIEKLGGGVSCDVYRVDVEGRSYCVKRALPKLRVAADWCAPVARSHTEVEWITLVSKLDPNLVAEILGEDRGRHLFVMKYYSPEHYPVWKSQLASGVVDVEFARQVGAALARIHAATAGRREVAAQFANDEQFYALRLEPYLLYAAERHADVAVRIRAISESIAGARIALMHGDFSPKNILCGPQGPMILDAETACYGDPAFDFAFCLNHLLLKCVWHREHRGRYLASFDALKDAYLARITWEDADVLAIRAAPLLAAFLLARVDGKSPVEYLADQNKEFVRQIALQFLHNSWLTLDGIAAHWRSRLEGG